MSSFGNHSSSGGAKTTGLLLAANFLCLLARTAKQVRCTAHHQHAAWLPITSVCSAATYRAGHEAQAHLWNTMTSSPVVDLGPSSADG
jgi:hypothetical protein